MEQELWLKKQIALINKAAQKVYSYEYKDINMNFFAAFSKFEGGNFGYLKEAKSFEIGLQIYAEFTENEAADVVEDIKDFFGEKLEKFTVEEIEEFYLIEL